jgi:hypothetical protein
MRARSVFEDDALRQLSDKKGRGLSPCDFIPDSSERSADMDDDFHTSIRQDFLRCAARRSGISIQEPEAAMNRSRGRCAAISR